MKYSLEYKKSAVSELLKLQADVAIKVKTAIDSLTVNPRPVGCRKLRGIENSYRIRIGNYRVV